ncbi:FAS1 domain-containing protein [Cladorrhinum sp. PSN259]|nr:FAS1 domain-containing protein [Cladorrhinum sp. PSN259]
MLRHCMTLLLGLSAAPALSQSLNAALQANGFTDFARIAAQVPSIANAAGPGLLIYASTNDAIREANLNRANAAGSRRRQDDGEPRPTPEEIECQTTNTHSQRQRRDTAVAPGTARQTFLDDPQLVNLGPGRNQTVVEKCIPGQVWPLIFSGLAINVSVVGPDIPFDGGLIRPVGGVFTVPAPLSESLKVSSLSTGTFLSALNKTGLLSDVDNRAGITVLAPTDAALASANTLPDAELTKVLQRHVLVNVTAYTPQLREGSTFVSLAGEKVTVTFKDGAYYLNDAKIVNGDVIIKNGVLHSIDKILGPSSTPTKSATATSPVATGSGHTVHVFSWSVAIWAVVFTAMVHVYGHL